MISDPTLGAVIPDTRLHPIYLITETAAALRQAVPYLAVTIFGGAPWWINATLFALVMVIPVAQWHVKRYSVVGGVLLLRGGLLNQWVQAVPVTRITALAASQSMTQRLIGVWGLNVRSPGDRNSSVVTLACLSGRRLDELRAALDFDDRIIAPINPNPSSGLSAIQRYLAWWRASRAVRSTHEPGVIAVLSTGEVLISAVTNYSIFVIFVAAFVAWFEFSEYLPVRAARFMREIIEPRGSIAVLITLAVVAIVGGVILGILRLSRFALTRDGDVLRTSRGLLGKQTAAIPIKRVQAVRVVEGFWRMLLGYCSLQVEVAGIAPIRTNQRMLFPLVRTDRAEALIQRALPELPWPCQPLRALPPRVRRRYLKVPLGFAIGLTPMMLFLPGWWRLLALFPVPLGYVLGVARGREARWWIDDQCVVLRWRRLLCRNTVIAHRLGAQRLEFSTSARKAKAGVAGFKMRFSSGRAAEIRYMLDSDALLLLHTVGRN